MKVLNFGSLNFDDVYEVDHFIQPKETMSSLSYMMNFGGKGANQSIALRKAGVEVYQAGKVGHDGQPYIDYLKQYDVDTSLIKMNPNEASGRAIIQVCKGENCILLFGGANQTIDETLIDEVLEHFEEGDYLLIQNEISNLGILIHKAHEKGMKIVFNIAPMNEKILTYPMNEVDMLIMNEVEAMGYVGLETNDYQEIISALQTKCPNQEVLLTVGQDGSYYIFGEEVIHQEAFKVEAVDTTAAGDTFTGYFLASKLQGKPIEECLRVASKASSLTVKKEGAAQSIPSLEEVEE